MDDMLGIPASAKETKIESVDPAECIVGDFVMIMGKGFGEEPGEVKVWVGRVPATVTDVVPDMIMIEAPSGVRRGAIKVKIGDDPMVKSSVMLEIKPQ